MTAEAYYRADGLFLVITDERIYAFTQDKYLSKLSLKLQWALDNSPEDVIKLLSTMKAVKKEFLFFKIISLLAKRLQDIL